MDENSNGKKNSTLFAALVIILILAILFFAVRLIYIFGENGKDKEEQPPMTTSINVNGYTENATKAKVKFPPDENMSEEIRNSLQGEWRAIQLSGGNLPQTNVKIAGHDISGSVAVFSMQGRVIYADDKYIYLYSPEYDMYLHCEISINSDGSVVAVPGRVINHGKTEKLPFDIGAIMLKHR